MVARYTTEGYAEANIHSCNSIINQTCTHLKYITLSGLNASKINVYKEGCGCCTFQQL